MYTLYGGRFTRAIIVRMVFAEAELEYQLYEVDIINNEHLQADFLRLNPAGYVPALVKPDGEVLHETHAINLYLIDHHQLRQLGPAVDEAERGRFLSALFFLADDLEPVMKQAFYPHRYVVNEQDIEAMRTRSHQQSIERLKIIDRQMQRNGPDYLGQRFSLIDVISCYWAEYIYHQTMLESLPGIKRCFDLVSQRPLLCGLFREVEQCRIEYERLQKAGKGVK
jgi:glutathione S-transferase